jgi:hypothetical protein
VEGRGETGSDFLEFSLVLIASWMQFIIVLHKYLKFAACS